MINEIVNIRTLYSLILFTFSLTLISCEEEELNITHDAVIEIAAGEMYRHVLSEYIPIEGGFKIKVQPNHFEVSEIKWTERGLEYFYKPPQTYKGYDSVLIENCMSIGDSNCNYSYDEIQFLIK